jgi:ketosteroid isomerase-like protein
MSQMYEPASPLDVMERLIDGISHGRWLELDELYADDAVIEYPFALPDGPARLAGRPKIRRYFAAIARQSMELTAHHIVIHETRDPEVVIAEYDYDMVVTTTARSLRVSNIQVTRIRDGQIVASRDYHNHSAMAEATAQRPSKDGTPL